MDILLIESLTRKIFIMLVLFQIHHIPIPRKVVEIISYIMLTNFHKYIPINLYTLILVQSYTFVIVDAFNYNTIKEEYGGIPYAERVVLTEIQIYTTVFYLFYLFLCTAVYKYLTLLKLYYTTNDNLIKIINDKEFIDNLYRTANIRTTKDEDESEEVIVMDITPESSPPPNYTDIDNNNTPANTPENLYFGSNTHKHEVIDMINKKKPRYNNWFD